MLYGYLEHVRREDLEQWRHAELIYALTAPHLKKDDRGKPPELPKTLKEHVNGHA